MYSIADEESLGQMSKTKEEEPAMWVWGEGKERKAKINSKPLRQEPVFVCLRKAKRTCAVGAEGGRQGVAGIEARGRWQMGPM